MEEVKYGSMEEVKDGSMEEVKDGRMEEVKDGRMEVALNGWDSHLYNPLSLREGLASETRLELPGLVPERPEGYDTGSLGVRDFRIFCDFQI